MAFLLKSYGNSKKVEKPVLEATRYEGSDDEEELKMVPVVNQSNNNYNIFSYSKIESDDESEQKLFDVDIDEEVEVTSKTHYHAKMVQAMKKLQTCITLMQQNYQASSTRKKHQ